MKNLFALLALLALAANAQQGELTATGTILDDDSSLIAWSGILAPERAKDWSTAGVEGGIPTNRTTCSTLAASSTTATIQSALNACPAGQAVVIQDGTVNQTADLTINKGVTLRSQNGPSRTGTGGTFWDTNGNNIRMSSLGSGSPSPVNFTNWTGCLTRGCTVLTVVSTTGISAGAYVILDELNRAWVLPNIGEEGNCSPANDCGREGTSFQDGDVRSMAQWVKVVSVDSATQITISEGVTYTHIAGNDPEVFFWDINDVVVRAGLEGFWIDSADGSFTVDMRYCANCWVKGNAFENIAQAAVYLTWSYGFEVRDNYLANDGTAEGPTRYGIECYNAGHGLIENNIAWRVTSPILLNACEGTVVGYNYTHNTIAGNLFISILHHLSHDNFLLFEGNVVNKMALDNSWGSSSHNTMFRNRVDGTGANKTNYTVPMQNSRGSRFTNLVANVLGTNGTHTNYICDQNHALGSDDDHIYDIGFQDNCGEGLTGYDSIARTSMMKWGNWDIVTDNNDGAGDGVLYCTGTGVPEARCIEDERASSDPTFPGLASPSTMLPASFYRSAKPDWFGSVPWPPIGPDVTGGNITGVAGHANKIPAQVCYESMSKDGTGFLTAFTPSTCYPVP